MQFNLMKCLFFCILTVSSFFASSYQMKHANKPFVGVVNNEVFRDEIVQFVKEITLKNLTNKPLEKLKLIDQTWNNRYQTSDWSVTVSIYYKGTKIGQGGSHHSSLSEALITATNSALNQSLTPNQSKETLKQYRFKISFSYYPANLYSFINYGTQGLELTGSRVAVRSVSIGGLKEQIQNSQQFLINTMDPQLFGFFKFYNAQTDTHENLLRTIYTSSSLYSFIKLYKMNQDPNLVKYFKPIADFILARQAQDGPNAGGFFYGYNPVDKKKSCLIVVGTTSKTIFTLIELNKFYPNEPKYLASARKAGDWLLTRISPEGLVFPVASCKTGKWIDHQEQSFLYSGQVLSALSRLYKETHNPLYYEGASKIAQHFLDEVKKQGTMLGDDYRPQNSISSSWVMMSLIDFAQVDKDPIYTSTIQAIAKTLLARQITNPDDVYNNGRYLDAMTASGNGWINEVMGVLYNFCEDKQLGSCTQYHQAAIRTSRWLLQNAYTSQNTYNVKNPARAIGGFMTNFTTNTVRTDAVCHGVNSLIMLLESVGKNDQVLMTLPERPLIEILPLIRAGNGFFSDAVSTGI